MDMPTIAEGAKELAPCSSLRTTHVDELDDRATWRILDLLVKGLAAVLISGAITFYAYGLTSSRSKRMTRIGI